MAGIEEYLNKIKNAVYGREVRQAIHDGIETCYKEGKAGSTDLEARQRLNSVEPDVSSLKSRMSTAESDIDVLDSRVDQIVAPSGKAPSAAEITDARIGDDGVTYTSLGIANRTQFSDLKSDMGRSDLTFTTVTGEYVGSDRVVKNGSNFNRSTPIFISAGSFVTFKAAGYNTNVAMIATCDENGNNIKAVVISTNSSVNTYTYYANADTYIILSYLRSQGYTFKVFDSKSNTILNQRLDEVESVTLDKTTPTYSATAGSFVNSAGQSVFSANFSKSSPIQVSANTLVALTATGYNTNVAMIATCDENGNNIKAVSVCVDSNEHTYTYFPEEDCYIIISYYTSKTHDLFIYGQSANVSLLERIEDVEDSMQVACKDILSAFTNITCIGDSLTYSAVFTDVSSYRQAYKPYPTILGQKTGTIAQNLGDSGATATSWWTEHNDRMAEKDNQLTIIYLGTNEGLTDTINTDLVGNDPTQWANTNTGNYGRIVAKALANGSKVVLVKCYRSSGNVETTNLVIEKMAEKFSVAVVDNPPLYDIKYHYNTNGDGYNSVHYNDFGYAVFTNQLIYNISNLPSELMKRILPV